MTTMGRIRYLPISHLQHDPLGVIRQLRQNEEAGLLTHRRSFMAYLQPCWVPLPVKAGQYQTNLSELGRAGLHVIARLNPGQITQVIGIENTVIAHLRYTCDTTFLEGLFKSCNLDLEAHWLAHGSNETTAMPPDVLRALASLPPLPRDDATISEVWAA